MSMPFPSRQSLRRRWQGSYCDKGKRPQPPAQVPQQDREEDFVDDSGGAGGDLNYGEGGQGPMKGWKE
jgi:hypothetical protein